jgi:hypothetical protein
MSGIAALLSLDRRADDFAPARPVGRPGDESRNVMLLRGGIAEPCLDLLVS